MLPVVGSYKCIHDVHMFIFISCFHVLINNSTDNNMLFVLGVIGQCDEAIDYQSALCIYVFLVHIFIGQLKLYTFANTNINPNPNLNVHKT